MAGRRAMEMSADETRKFVELYIGNECLWNPLSPIYTRRDFRLAASRRIISEMGNGMTEEQVAKKIACLRTCYARELKKLMDLQEKAKLSDDYEFTYKPRWQFFEMLDPYLRPSVLQNSSYFHNMDGTTKDDSSPENKIDIKEKEASMDEKVCDDLEVSDTTVHVNSTCLGNPQNSGLTTYPKENDIICDVNNTYLATFQKSGEPNEVPSCSGEYEYDTAVSNTPHHFSNTDITNTVTSPGSTSTHKNRIRESNGIHVRTTETKCNTGKHKSYGSSEKACGTVRMLEMRKRKADNLESTMLGVLTRLEKKISVRAAENNGGTSLKPNSDELFSQHLANLMQKVPESKAKWEMQLKLQQTILDYIPD